MKTILAAIAVVALIAGANAMAHGGKCEAGCNYCDDKGDMVTVYDKLKTNATVMKANDATGPHVPFLCRVNSNNRRLAAHAVGVFRIAVDYADHVTLHPMNTAHHIDMIQVVDASSKTHSRALAAHGSTLLFQKTWAATSDFAEKNPCMDFTLLKDKEVTHLQTFEHCNLHGPFMSEKIAIADIPDCKDGMAAKAGRRNLAAHAGKCFKVENGDCGDDHDHDHDATAKSPATTTAVTTAFVIASIFAFLRLF